MEAGKLRHRVILESPVYEQDAATGAMTPGWAYVAEVWAAIEPLSARDLITAQAHQSKVTARIVMRQRPDLRPDMRINHNGRLYLIEGILADKESGLEYVTIPVRQLGESEDGEALLLENNELFLLETGEILHLG